MPLDGWDHVELWVGNAKQAAFFYEHAYGFTRTAYAGPETGVRDRASYVLEQGDIRLVLTSGLREDSEITRFACRHGDGAHCIGLRVPSAQEAYRQAEASPWPDAVVAATHVFAEPRTPSPPPAQAAVPPDASALLSKAAAVYSDGNAHAAAFTQIYTPAGFASAKRESGTVWVQAPQRLRFDYSAPEQKVFTYDAGEGRFFSPDDKQLTVRKLTQDEQARLPLVFLSKPEDLSARYEITLDASGAILLTVAPQIMLAISASTAPTIFGSSCSPSTPRNAGANNSAASSSAAMSRLP